MKNIKLISPDYIGKVEIVRHASRGIIIKDNKILLGYETKEDQYIIPGGGIENNESIEECLIREIKEETGIIIDNHIYYLEIEELFLNMKHINHYFFVDIKEETNELSLTDLEIEHELTTKWLDFNEAIKIFSSYELYKNINIPKYGLYRRELIALMEYLDIR